MLMAWPPDISVPRAVLIALGVTVLLAVVVAASTSSTAFSLYNTGWEGTSELRGVTEAAGATYRVGESTRAYTRVDANRTIAVVLAPAEPYTDADRRRIQTFLEAGGTLVVAGDVGPTTNDLLAALGAQARLHGGLLRDERHHFRGPALPVATNVTANPLMAGVDRLTLNHATPVRPHGATVLVRTSPYAYVDANNDSDLDDREVMRSWPVATREPVGDGTLVVVGDPSVFINTMLDHPDNRKWFRHLAATHDTVLLDTSHSAAIPPLAALALVLRDAIWVQVLAAVSGIALVVAGTSDAVRARLDAVRSGAAPDPRVSKAAVERAVMERHPDWEADRVDRVVEGVMRQRRGGGDDD